MKRDENRSIWKQPLDLTDKQTVEMPQGSRFLAVQMQRNVITVWFHCRITMPKVPVTFYVIGTGHPFPDEIYLDRHIGTVQSDGFVWHVFFNEGRTP